MSFNEIPPIQRSESGSRENRVDTSPLQATANKTNQLAEGVFEPRGGKSSSRGGVIPKLFAGAQSVKDAVNIAKKNEGKKFAEHFDSMVEEIVEGFTRTAAKSIARGKTLLSLDEQIKNEVIKQCSKDIVRNGFTVIINEKNGSSWEKTFGPIWTEDVANRLRKMLEARPWISQQKIDAIIKGAGEEAAGDRFSAFLREDAGLGEEDVQAVLVLVQCERGEDLLTFLQGHADLSEKDAIRAMMLMQHGASANASNPLNAMGTNLGEEWLAFIAQKAEMVCTIDEETKDLSIERRELYLSKSPDWEGPSPVVLGTTIFQIPRNGSPKATVIWEFRKNQLIPGGVAISEVRPRPFPRIELLKFQDKISRIFQRSVPKDIGVVPQQKTLFEEIARADSMKAIERSLEKSAGLTQQMDYAVTDLGEGLEELYQKIDPHIDKISFLTRTEERQFSSASEIFDYLTAEIGLTVGQASRVLAQLSPQVSNQMETYLEGQFLETNAPITCSAVPDSRQVRCNLVGQDVYIEHGQLFSLRDLTGDRPLADISASTYIAIPAEGEPTAFWGWQVNPISSKGAAAVEVGAELTKLFAQVQSVEECVRIAEENRGESFREESNQQAENIYGGFRTKVVTAFLNRERTSPGEARAAALTKDAICEQIDRDLLNHPIRFTIRAEDGAEREKIFDRDETAENLLLFLQGNVGLSEDLALRAMAAMQQGGMAESLLPVALIGGPLGLGISGSAGWTTNCTIEGGALAITQETVAQLRPAEPRGEAFPAFRVATEYGFSEGQESTAVLSWEILGNQGVI